MSKKFNAFNEWINMPEFIQEKLVPYKEIKIRFATKEDYEEFASIINQNLTKQTKSIWHPKVEKKAKEGLRYFGKNLNPKYPIYIISKGRWDTRLTSKALEKMNVPYYIVIEPQEFENYAKYIDEEKILTLPFSNLGQGSIPARNWVWEHAIQSGAKKHWILDDNINSFNRMNRNLQPRCTDGSIFRIAEDFVDRYENVPMAGFNYHGFANSASNMPPFYLNTRVYSCILLDNSLKHRWRGRYNEDTDLSLRILKDGYCTILFNAFLADKTATMTMTGGNSDELYVDDGRKKMAESLQEQHPDVVKVVWKWDRWQHEVDYRPFKKNKLIKKKESNLNSLDSSNDYGMYIIDTNDNNKIVDDYLKYTTYQLFANDVNDNHIDANDLFG